MEGLYAIASNWFEVTRDRRSRVESRGSYYQRKAATSSARRIALARPRRSRRVCQDDRAGRRRRRLERAFRGPRHRADRSDSQSVARGRGDSYRGASCEQGTSRPACCHLGVFQGRRQRASSRRPARTAVAALRLRPVAHLRAAGSPDGGDLSPCTRIQRGHAPRNRAAQATLRLGTDPSPNLDCRLGARTVGRDPTLWYP